MPRRLLLPRRLPLSLWWESSCESSDWEDESPLSALSEEPALEEPEPELTEAEEELSPDEAESEEGS